MEKKCVIKVNNYTNLSNGYTKVKVLPEAYAKIITITGITGQTIQDVANSLLLYALEHTQIEGNDGQRINIDLLLGGGKV